MQIWHTDLAGPLTPISCHGELYVAPYIDEKSRYAVGRLFKKKSDQLDSAESLRIQVETQLGVKIKVLRSDNGGEFKSKASEAWSAEHGIHLQYTTPYSPVENSVAERFNRSSMEMVRSLLTQSGIPKPYWGYVYEATVYIKNRIPHTSVGMTPYEGFKGEKPNLSNLRAIGCKAYYRIPDVNRKKLDQKAKIGVHLGYDSSNDKAYVILDWDSRKIVRTRNVTFDEGLFPFKNQLELTDEELSDDDDINVGIEGDIDLEVQLEDTEDAEVDNEKEVSFQEELTEPANEPIREPVSEPRRSSRKSVP